MSSEEIANILEVTEGVNASTLSLPEANLPNKPFAIADTWSAWTNAGHDYLGQSVNGGEFLAYRLTVDSGEKVTLVMFSWSQGGFDGCALVDGHSETLCEAAEMWLGNTAADEYSNDHQIHEIITA